MVVLVVVLVVVVVVVEVLLVVAVVILEKTPLYGPSCDLRVSALLKSFFLEPSALL